jgi:chorismate mutase/prephenate dehydrogenase
MTDTDPLDLLRAELSSVDEQLIALVARRQHLSLEIGRTKRTLGMGTRDFAREKVVLDMARGRAVAAGVPPSLAERLMLALIEASLGAQEQDRVSRQGQGDGRRALVLGGSGKMGGWFVTFLANQGWEIEVADPSPPASQGLAWRADWRDGPLDHDLILVATPLSATNEALHALASARPPGIVVDVASLKTPLRSGLLALREAGVRVTSMHPMFGPDVNLLSGRHVLFVDVGDPAATDLVRSLFEATMAEQSAVDLDMHDQLMAFVLGLSHALNLAFNDALAQSGEDLPLLSRISSSTFEAQLGISTRVARENPHLYYEIQAFNDHGSASLDALVVAVSRLRDTVSARDRSGFIELMQHGRDYVTTRGA